MTGRVCAHCHKPLQQRPQEPPYRFRTRDTCDRACYLELRRAGVKPSGTQPVDNAPRTCIECGTVFARRANERFNRWAARTCCSKPCSAKRARAANVAKAAARPKPKMTVKPMVIPAAPKPAVPEAERKVWRPAGWTPVPNQWAGHRPGVAS